MKTLINILRFINVGIFAIAVFAIGIIGWFWFRSIPTSVMTVVLAAYYFIELSPKYGEHDPAFQSIKLFVPVWLWRWAAQSNGAFLVSHVLFAAISGCLWFWQIVAWMFMDSGYWFYPPIVHFGTFWSGIYFSLCWWVTFNAAVQLIAVKFWHEPRRWYLRLKDRLWPVDVSERLKGAFEVKFKWNPEKFRVAKKSKDIYLLDTDNIPVSNNELLANRQELENAARTVIISINPIEARPGDFTIRTGKFLIDAEGNSTATKEDLFYPTQDHPRWLSLVPICNLGYPGGGFCIDLEKTPHIGFIASQGQGKTTAIRSCLSSIAEQFTDTAFVVYDPKGGIDWFSMQWDMRLFDDIDRDDLYDAQLDTPMLQNFTLLTEQKEFKRIANFVIKEYGKRKQIFQRNGCDSYAQYISKVGYKNSEVPRIVIVIEELRFIYGNKVLFAIYKDLARILELARAYGIICIVGSQAPQQEALTQLRDSMKLFTFGATENQNEYLLGVKFRGPKLPGVCSLQLYDQSNTVAYGFLVNTTQYDTSCDMADAQYSAIDGNAWDWIVGAKNELQAEGRQPSIRQNQQVIQEMMA